MSGGVYLYGPLTLDVALYPLQPVRVLLLPDPLVDLRAQFLGSLQSFSQRAAVCVTLWGVLQDLTEEEQVLYQRETSTRSKYQKVYIIIRHTDGM